ncbi:MAG: hypothetical protein GQ565_10495 [Candidatus Aegiribacteria sp.]|nr:hypothetical protein [Candidatus Aegiribacteria sp.]
MKRGKGIFRGIARNVEWRNEGKFTVVFCKLEQVDEDGNITNFVPVTIREKKILGNLNDSDEIELGGKIKADGMLKPKIVYNKTTQAYMKQPKLPLVVTLAFLLSCIFLSIHIVSGPTMQPKVIPIKVFGGSAAVVSSSVPVPAWQEQINDISLYLALSLFIIAAMITLIRITRAATPYWLSKLNTRIPVEVRLTLIFSVIFLIGLFIMQSLKESSFPIAFILLFIIAYSLISGISISKARRKMKS